MAVVTNLAVYENILMSSDFTSRLRVWCFDIEIMKLETLSAEIDVSMMLQASSLFEIMVRKTRDI
jgi:hypothetical protein